VHPCGDQRPRCSHGAASLLHEEDKAILQKAPSALGVSGIFENCSSFARCCDFHLFRTL
jgi:hypothetical protein